MIKKRVKYIPIISILFLLTYNMPEAKVNDQDQSKKLKLTHNSMKRMYWLHEPANDKSSSKKPLLIVLHGVASTGKNIMLLTKKRFNELSDEKGFYVAYPDGVENHWSHQPNDPKNPSGKKIDHVSFISSLIDFLVKNYNIDSNKIYVAGFSNGGYMALKLACELTTKIHGIAVVGAAFPVDMIKSCSPSRTIPVIIINGTKDPVVPYNGGNVVLFGKKLPPIISTEETLNFWKNKNSCSGTAKSVELKDIDPKDGTRVKKISYESCKNGSHTILYKIENGGHTWPGGSQYLYKQIIGRTCRDINACDEIWSFFSEIK